MASNSQKTKAETASKKEAGAKNESTAAKDAAKEPPKDAAKPEGGAKSDGGETAAAPANYGRGEGQKPVTAAYRENWNAIFAKKKTKKKKR